MEKINKLTQIWNQFRAQSNLFKGILKDDIVRVEKALKYGADLEKGYNPSGADPLYHGDDTNITALSLALQNQKFEIARFLIEKGANPFGDAPNMWMGAPIVLILNEGKLDLLWLVQEKWNVKELSRAQIAPVDFKDYKKGFPFSLKMKDEISFTDYLRSVNPENALKWEAMNEKKSLEKTLPSSSLPTLTKSHRL